MGRSICVKIEMKVKKIRDMKIIVWIALLGLIIPYGSSAQEYKLQKSTGKLDIRDVNDVKIEGYNGSEIIFTSRSFNGDRDKRAEGLRAISSMGLEDNTGIGLSVLEVNGIIEVRQLKKMDGPDILIKVPKGVSVAYTHTSPHGSDLQVNDIAAEIDVSTVHNDVLIENATGLVKVKTVHGNIDAKFSTEIKNALDLTSTHGHVDVTLPASTKANLKLSTSWGEIFVDPNIKLEIDKSGDMVKYSDKISARLNGGGVVITLSSVHDNVYLRQK